MSKIQELVDAIEAMRSPRRLLVLAERIRQRMQYLGVSRSHTDLMGHYAEWLSQKVLGGELNYSSSQSGYDLVDAKGRKVQIKGRVLRGVQAQRGAKISEKNLGKFDYLVLVVFDAESYKVVRAIGMTDAVFVEISRVSNDFSVWRITSEDHLQPGVDDLTDAFRNAQ